MQIFDSHKTALIVPTNRLDRLHIFLEAWGEALRKSCIQTIVIEDAPDRSAGIPPWVEHYSWREIDADLGADSWIISRKSASVRSYGLLLAWRAKAEYIFTIDDDCLPEPEVEPGAFFEMVVGALTLEIQNDAWWNTMPTSVFPRGYPYAVRSATSENVLHHGLWSNIPDLDAQTQKQIPDYRSEPARELVRIPSGAFFPMSSMNLAFKRKALPFLYFLLMGENNRGEPWGYDRFDDIWAGIMFKKIADRQGWAVTSGCPSVWHSRASNVDVNLMRERTGLEANEWFWEKIRAVEFFSPDPYENYVEIARALEELGGYWKKLSAAMQVWMSLIGCMDNDSETRQAEIHQRA